jgi:hypothetical protein
LVPVLLSFTSEKDESKAVSVSGDHSGAWKRRKTMSLRDLMKVGWLVPGLLLLHSSLLAQEGRIRLPGEAMRTAPPAQVRVGGFTIEAGIAGVRDAEVLFRRMGGFDYRPEDWDRIREELKREQEFRHESWKRDQEWRREWEKRAAEQEREAWKHAEEQDREYWNRTEELNREAWNRAQELEREEWKRFEEQEREARKREDEFQRESFKKEAEWHRENSKKMAEIERETWKRQRENQGRGRRGGGGSPR